MNNNIFRKYDIRGIVDSDLPEDVIVSLGKAFGTRLIRAGKKNVLLGGDCRKSTLSLKQYLQRGLITTGCNVIDIGICTSPVLYFGLHTMDVDGGIMVTGSHNPPEYNGFKIAVGKETIYGEAIQELRQNIEARDFEEGKGLFSQYDLIADYIQYMSNAVNITNPFKVVIDAGNGTAGVIMIPILKKMGVDVLPVFCELDGNFPNHHPDPTIEENLSVLKKKVIEEKADVGIGFDGDGDRIGVVDNSGSVIWQDILLLLLAREILKENPGASIIGDVKCSQVLYQDIAQNGGKPIMWKTGHSLIKAKIKETKALLAGEMSGHFFFADRYYGFDDGIYAALRLMEFISASDMSFSNMLESVPTTFATPEIRIEFSDEEKEKIVSVLKEKLQKKYVVNDLDGIRVNFDHGWALLRASNTQPVLVMRFEADTNERLIEYRKRIESMLKEAMG